MIKLDVAPTAVNAPKLSVKTNPEQLERILLHLLNNAAEFTPEGGKIWLDFKKRGAHTHQFIVSDTGSGIAEEEHGSHQHILKVIQKDHSFKYDIDNEHNKITIE